jgi:hypothetical protein
MFSWEWLYEEFKLQMKWSKPPQESEKIGIISLMQLAYSLV